MSSDDVGDYGDDGDERVLNQTRKISILSWQEFYLLERFKID